MTGNSEHAGSVPLADAEPQRAQAAESPSQVDSTPREKPSLVGQLAMVGLGVVAGAAGAQLIYYTQGILPRPALGGMPPYPPELVAAANRAAMGELAIGFGLAGALIAAVLGAGVGLLRRSARPALTGMLTGLVAGAFLGALGGVLNSLLHRQIEAVEMDDLFRAMLIHAPFWICLSIALGLAVGLAVRDISTAHVIGATVGAAIIASLLYPLLSMVLFPAARPEAIIPADFGARILWIASGAAILAWAAARTVPSKAS